MNKKRRIIVTTISIILLIIFALWISGIIPKQIARIFATNYLKKNFPQKQYEYIDIEWSSSFGGYSIKFKDENDKIVGFIMNNKYFPISPGQGIFALEEEYREEYGKQNESEHFFYGKVVESTSSYIIVEPNENEEERKSSDKISIGLGEYTDALYMVGTNVKITYDGYIMESYPAQIKATKIEVKSAENFEIVFYDKHPMKSYKIYTILDKSETDKYDYTIYGFDGSVNVKIDGKDYSLKEALTENKITMEEIIAKANKDFPNALTYDDGGSIEYHYENYTIIKIHKLDGNRDVYIGTKDMTINDLGI
ncbi:MAG: DUF3221 domain-containing protein [Clostridia bacterium]